MTDLTPDALDEWRMDQTCDKVDFNTHLGALQALQEYRRLVRENVLPPAEPDQDTLDTRVIMAAVSEALGTENCAKFYREGLYDQGGQFRAAKAALTEIKARVRREAIKEHIAAEQKRRLRMQQAPAMGRDMGWI